MGVAIGVDSHRSSLAAAALDEPGRVLGTRELSHDALGHQSLLKWAIAQGEGRVIGIEGGGSYGAGLARHLLDAGEDVYEVAGVPVLQGAQEKPVAGQVRPRRRGRYRSSYGAPRGAVLAAAHRGLRRAQAAHRPP
jgi:Transposase